MVFHLCGVMMLAGSQTAGRADQRVRFATFNVKELSSAKLSQVDAERHGTHPQLCKAAEIIQRARPHVLLINEIDFDFETRRNAALFAERYLGVSQQAQAPLSYPYVFFEPVNTGVPTNKDLDKDGRTGGPADAFGYGRYPGQYGMALFSVFPMDTENARTFAKFLWKDMPDHHMPDGRNGRPAWYAPEDVAILRLSSKSHWDVPVRIAGRVVHVICAHPTPPIFDGPEDRNGRRTFDEIRLLADYVKGAESGAYLVDDRGRRGPLATDALFVIMGDLNADPVQDDAPYGQPAINQLLRLSRVQDPLPSSKGSRGGGSAGPPDFPERRTSDFGRIDYVLPSVGLRVLDQGVFWPGPDDPLCWLVEEPDPASDHRLVWVDVASGNPP